MSEVLLEVKDGVAWVVLNRPQARNAVNGAAALALAEAVDTVHERSDIRVAVLSGANGNFCAGMDLKAFLNNEQVRLPGRGFAGFVQTPLRKPFIAAVEGYALAGGFEIALGCHMIAASNEAKFGLPEVKRGLVPNAGGLLRLPRQLPEKLAHELILSGELVSAGFLASHGLINRVTEPGEALTAAREMADQIASNGPLAVEACIAVMRERENWRQAEMFDQQDEITQPIFASEDAREGARAFAEKRAPVWRGM